MVQVEAEQHHGDGESDGDREDAVDDVDECAAEECDEAVGRRREQDRQGPVLTLVGHGRDDAEDAGVGGELHRVAEREVQRVLLARRVDAELDEEKDLRDRQQDLVRDVAADARPLEEGDVLQVRRAYEDAGLPPHEICDFAGTPRLRREPFHASAS